VRSADELRGLLDTPPLAVIPEIRFEAAVPPARRVVVAAAPWLAVAVGGTLFVIFVHVFYKPLDVLWFTVLRKFGV
jgi:hypothetical protein